MLITTQALDTCFGTLDQTFETSKASPAMLRLGAYAGKRQSLGWQIMNLLGWDSSTTGFPGV